MNKEVEQIFEFLELYEDLYKKYDKINEDMQNLHQDYGTYAKAIDGHLMDSIVEVFDTILERYTGFENLIGYYLWDMPTTGGKITMGKRSHMFKDNLASFKKAVSDMIDYKEKQ